MNDASAQDMIDRLDRLLERERRALLGGEMEEILRMVEDKEALVGALNAADAPAGAALQALHRKVLRNQSLLDGTLQGIRQVAGRIAALRRIRKTLETYDATGRKRTIDGEVAHRMEKRA